MNRNNLEFSKAKDILQEGDVLLFRGQGIISRLIGRSGESKYSHVGVASLHNDIWECVEFREWKGGRTVNLKNYVDSSPGIIDVYRPIPFFSSVIYDPTEHKVVVHRKPFDGKAVTSTMRKMTGLPYGWTRICWIAKHKLVGFRLFYDVSSLMDDTLKEVVYPVCSTTVAYSFSLDKSDLVKNKADEWTEPADIARSARLNYILTLIPN